MLLGFTTTRDMEQLGLAHRHVLMIQILQRHLIGLEARQLVALLCNNCKCAIVYACDLCLDPGVLQIANPD